MTKLIVTFRNIAKAPKSWGITFLQCLSLFEDQVTSRRWGCTLLPEKDLSHAICVSQKWN